MLNNKFLKLIITNLTRYMTLRTYVSVINDRCIPDVDIDCHFDKLAAIFICRAKRRRWNLKLKRKLSLLCMQSVSSALIYAVESLWPFMYNSQRKLVTCVRTRQPTFLGLLLRKGKLEHCCNSWKVSFKWRYQITGFPVMSPLSNSQCSWIIVCLCTAAKSCPPSSSVLHNSFRCLWVHTKGF